MGVVASVHIADVGVANGLRLVTRTPKPGSVAGLRHANLAIAAPLRTGQAVAPTPSRIALIAFWEGDDAIDRFVASHPLGAKLAGGWSARITPLRAYGSWPGLPDDLSTSRTTDYHGPAVVLTLGRLRLSQAIRFMRTSQKAEAAARVAPGMLWGTALARPPFVATCSLWESTRALSTYAFATSQPAHPHAIDADRAKPFHHQSAFVRLRPYDVRGALAGGNPLPEYVGAQVLDDARQ